VRDAPVIAIVDDDESFREALERFLGTFAFRVRTFASGEEFLQSRELGFVTCLLLDLVMPGMRGLEVKQQLGARGLRFPTVSLQPTPMTWSSNASSRPARSRCSQNLWTSRCYFAWCKEWWTSATTDSARHTGSGVDHLDSLSRLHRVRSRSTSRPWIRLSFAEASSAQQVIDLSASSGHNRRS
jgi:CheY-like chemotaxis protein